MTIIDKFTPRTDHPIWEWELRMAVQGSILARKMEEALSDASGLDVHVEVLVYVSGETCGIVTPSDVEEYSYLPIEGEPA